MPGDRHFCDVITQISGNGQRFNVKAPAIHRLSAKNRLGSLGAKALEAALCILNAG